ncbi:flagellar basal-body rod protein FlgG [Gottschalkia purinilytica]|uniref:Flagellar basal-body rod protein FlgG n=1 Tax=Gottschalkia purinilytica TaxID=1503 RepID=A0A0L0WE39_GOTPU|nr:flagellar hook-basal body complex protein [Gottschalkia purinilytica]KNF09701.1 flagellar basal-body rod protein FlgG [Gottschalkia purinilytica]
MNVSLYTAATSMLLNEKLSDIISNNLANVNTTGFKRDIGLAESFPEILLSKINDRYDFENHQPFTGVRQEEVTADGVYSISINSGYFRVGTPAGISHNRELKFIIDQDGYLKTYYRDLDGNPKSDGENYVLGRDGRAIRVPNRNNFQIAANGNISSNGQVIGNLVTFPAPNVIGTTSGGVRFDRIATDFTDGSYINTGNDLDFAIKGEGFFKVQGRDGNVYYTRDGSFTLNRNGQLVTKDGLQVLGQNGPIVLQGDPFSVAPNGDIIVNGNIVNRLDVVQINNKEYLRKHGDNMYRMAENTQAEEGAFNGEVVNGYIEGSNVNTIKEMVQMIAALRNYESSQKVIKSQDELLEKVVNELGRV